MRTNKTSRRLFNNSNITNVVIFIIIINIIITLRTKEIAGKHSLIQFAIIIVCIYLEIVNEYERVCVCV